MVLAMALFCAQLHIAQPRWWQPAAALSLWWFVVMIMQG